MEPSLDDLMADARLRLRDPSNPTLVHLERRWLHLQAALAVARGQATAAPEPAGETKIYVVCCVCMSA
jgi:hypothetical protein